MFKLRGIRGTWREVADACRNTIGLGEGKGEPTDIWKRRILISEHSPIRKMSIMGKWYDLPYWVSTHFVRHKFGIDHFITTQRTDRTGQERGSKPQDAPVIHEIDANVQAIINISRKRLCNCASPETRQEWKSVIREIEKVDPIIPTVCVPECVYRGFCPEFFPCGYDKTDAYKKALAKYRSGINGN